MATTHVLDRKNGSTTVVGDDRQLTFRRFGAKITIRSDGAPLTEVEARRVCMDWIADGERLLDCITRSRQRGRSIGYSFVVWPGPLTHSSRLLAKKRAA